MASATGGAVAAALLMGATTTFALNTPVSPPDPGEKSHAEIFSHHYGGSFVLGGNGVDYSNGFVTAQRVDDAWDTIFQTDGFHAIVRAVFAEYTQSFGYMNGASGGSYTNLIDVVDEGYAATGSSLGVQIDGEFRFARDGQGPLVTSLPGDNGDFMDHLVTYQILGTGLNESIMMLFWEDTLDGHADFDFNDLVVEVIGARTVPTPAALTAGLAMLGTFMLRRRRHA